MSRLQEQFKSQIIKDLYEKNNYKNKNGLWGHKYYLLRNEFIILRKKKFQQNLTKSLIMGLYFHVKDT